MDTGMDREICQRQGLHYDVVAQHQRLLLRAAREPHWPAQPVILDCCRTDNGGVLRVALDRVGVESDAETTPRTNIAALIPAAGAATRYVSALRNLLEAFISQDQNRIADCLEGFPVGAADSWALPKAVSEARPWAQKDLDPEIAERLLSEMNAPKALFPCVEEGQSFLALKTLEHAALPRIKKQIFVCPPGKIQDFSRAVDAVDAGEVTGMSESPNTSFYEQGTALSTVRFDEDGTPVKESSSSDLETYSVVPAGHGALVQLFPQIVRDNPDVDALFIRNIDNVSGTSEEFLRSTEGMFRYYDGIASSLRDIRAYLADEAYEQAAAECDKLTDLNPWSVPGDEHKAFLDAQSPIVRRIWTPLFSIFHCPAQPGAALSDARQLYERPFNLMGVVPNNGSDVGGTPVFIESDSRRCKVCLELPHASPEDRSHFLENPEIATHFNPVFVIAELTSDVSGYMDDEGKFWLLARKNWKGKNVRYFETVLYELLGNSDMANIAFLEVPRFVFNPHKSPQDTSSRTLKDWIPKR